MEGHQLLLNRQCLGDTLPPARRPYTGALRLRCSSLLLRHPIFQGKLQGARLRRARGPAALAAEVLYARHSRLCRDVARPLLAVARRALHRLLQN